MDQSDRACGQGHRHAGADELALPRGQFDVFCAVEVDAGVVGVGATGQGQIGVEPAQGHGSDGGGGVERCRIHASLQYATPAPELCDGRVSLISAWPQVD